MGLSHAWVALQGVTADDVIAALGAGAGRQLEQGELPDLGVGQLPGGWTLVLSSDVDAWLSGPLAPLTRMGAAAVACSEEEHVMASDARGFRDGVEAWRVVYHCEEGLQTAGDLPAAFARLREEAEREESENPDVDSVYDVGPLLAQATCGFKIGESDLPVFTELRMASRRARTTVGDAPRKPGLLQRLFARK
jgi:hypothetical protein